VVLAENVVVRGLFQRRREDSMNDLAYKPNFREVIQRLRLLQSRQAMDRIFASVSVPSDVLEQFARQYGEGFCAYPDPRERAAFWDQFLAERAAIEDDSLPCAYLSEMDQGLYGGLLGGEVQFMAHPENGWISSMVAPLLRDWSEFDRLRFDPNHEWFERYREQLRVFVEAARGKFAVSHFILIDGLNFVFELLGATETYLSLVERPEMVRRAIDLAFELNVAVQQTFFEYVPLIEGGTASNMAQWIPGRIVSESVDPFHMTSVEYFETWGREPVQRIFDRFDGGVVHIHGNGRHLLEAVCTLRRLHAIYLGDDKGFPQAFDILPQLRARTGDIPLVLAVDYPRFLEKLNRHELVGGVFYKVSGAPDAAAANRLMEKVRAYRAG
jgi:hypothetical protein